MRSKIKEKYSSEIKQLEKETFINFSEGSLKIIFDEVELFLSGVSKEDILIKYNKESVTYSVISKALNIFKNN